MNRSFRQILLLFVLTIFALTSSVFAWLSLTKVNNISGINSNIPDYSNIMSFYVTRNDEEFNIKSIAQMHEVFGDTKPGEKYLFKISIHNTSSKDIKLTVTLRGLKTLYKDNIVNDYDMLRVFTIVDGIVTSTYNKNSVITSVIHTIPVNNTNIVKDINGQELSTYRLDNLVNSFNEINLYPHNSNDDNIIEVNEKVDITFTLKYFDTSDTSYQNNMLNIAGIYVLGQ